VRRGTRSANDCGIACPERPEPREVAERLRADAELHEAVLLGERGGFLRARHRLCRVRLRLPVEQLRELVERVALLPRMTFHRSTSCCVTPGILSHSSSAGTFSICASFPSPSTIAANERALVSRQTTSASSGPSTPWYLPASQSVCSCDSPKLVFRSSDLPLVALLGSGERLGGEVDELADELVDGRLRQRRGVRQRRLAARDVAVELSSGRTRRP
jgi:hypothetical protein